MSGSKRPWGGSNVELLIPNPPKDTDGRREDRRRGMRELQGRWPGLDWGRWEVGGGSSVTAQAPNGRLRELGCAGWQENRQQGTPAELVGASWRGRWVSGGGRRQAGSGMARSRARARLNWVSQGQRCGRCRVRRRAERVRRPARAKTRRLRVLVVTIRSPRPMRAVQRARLWAIACTASQAPLAAKRPDGMWFSPTPYLRSRIAFSISA